MYSFIYREKIFIKVQHVKVQDVNKFVYSGLYISNIVVYLYIYREKVYIEVQDVNEFVPHWKEEMYIREVEEGRIVDQILQLEAVDEDGSSDLSRICHYHLNTPDVPFKVDSHGRIMVLF
jgi:hypothetical protein